MSDSSIKRLPLILFVVTVCVFLFKLWWSRRRLRQLASRIPGPSTIPMLGNFHKLIGGPDKPFKVVRELFDDYKGKLSRAWFGPFLYVFVTSAEDVEKLCVKERLLNRDRFVMEVMKKYLGNGLITSRGDIWRKQRKIIAPTFGAKVIDTYFEVFNGQTNILLKNLAKVANGEAFDIHPLLGLATLDMICESTMGIDLKSQMGENAALSDYILSMMSIGYQRLIKPWLMIDSLFHLTAMGRKNKQLKKALNDISDTVIRNKLKEFFEEKTSEIIYDEVEEEKRKIKKKTFLDKVISSSESEGALLSNKQLMDEVITVIVAGLETTATSMAFTLMMLGYHPQVQEDVLQELKEVFADDWERPVTPEDVKQLQCLDRVIKETLRIFPAVFFMLREVPKEIQLSTCTLPAGCVAFIPNYFVHRDPRFFPDPERFDPDRFLPERSQGRHPYSYIPFGAGPRICVGYKYAEMEMAVTLASVLRRYKFQPAVAYECLQKLEISAITRPTCGFQVKMLPRE